ncbi:MAG: LamG domain-containing protein [archaeon]
MHSLIYKKKAVSPIIATVLLVVITVVITIIILNWGRFFTNDTTARTNSIIQNADSINGLIVVTHASNNIVYLKNTSYKYDANIISYKLLSTTLDYAFLDESFELESSVYLAPSSSVELEIACFPGKEFNLDLLTTAGKYVNLHVVVDQATANSCLNYGTVLFYDFSDVTSLDLTDKSTSSNNGSAQGTTINEFWQDGKSNASFDGTESYVSVDNSTSLNFAQNSFSIEAAIKTTGTDDVYYPIVSKSAGGNTNQYLLTLDSDGYPLIRIGNGTTYQASYSTDLRDSNYHHIIAVIDRTTNLMNIYLDNTKSSDTNISSAQSVSNSNSLYIGYGGDFNSSNFFKGNMKLVKVYNRALTSAEVEDLYNEFLRKN